MIEIIGIQIGTTLYFGLEALREWKRQNFKYTQVIQRGIAQMMSSFDMGKKWDDLVHYPTLFYVNEDGIELLNGHQVVLKKNAKLNFPELKKEKFK